MSRRSSRRPAAGWWSARTRNHASRASGNAVGHSLYGSSNYVRRLRLEPLEDRRLLAVVTVTTLDDTIDLGDGVTSLREAIFATNTVPGADTVEFAPELTAEGPATILLTQGELAITDSLTIEGPGANLLTIDAGGNDPTPDMNNGDGSGIFRVDDGEAQSLLDVSMSGLTFTGVDANGFQEGIVWSRENLTLDDVVVRDNYVQGTTGIFNQFGTLTVFRSVFESNESRGSVGLVTVVDGCLTVADTQFTNNRSYGSIVRVEHGRADFERVNIADNVLTLGASAVHVQGTDFVIVDSSICDNQQGSGIIVAHLTGEFKLIDSTVSNNGVVGIWLAELSNATVLLQKSVVSGNGATGIRVGSSVNGVSAALKIDECNVTHNGISLPRGGGIEANVARGSISVRDSLISGNINRGQTTTGSYFGRAGGLALNLALDVTAQIVNCSISSNEMPYPVFSSAGGVTIVGGDAVIRDCEIAENSGVSGGVLISRGSAVVQRSTVRDNAAQYYGGGILSDTVLMVLDSVIANNTAGDGGGLSTSGIYGSAQIFRSEVTGNTAVIQKTFNGGRGGGIYGRNFSIVDSTIDGNTADVGGGAWLRDASIINSTVSNNRALIGGGIHASNVSVDYTTITRNVASSSDGFINGHGGGIFVDGTSLTLSHSIVAQNGGLTPDLAGLLGSTISAEYSLIGNSTGSGLTPAPVGSPDANGNLIGGTTLESSIDAMLDVLADNGEFELPDGSHMLTHALLAGSPAINAGDPAAEAGQNGVPLHDQRGAPYTRVFGGRIDMGAVESIPAGILPGDYNGDGIVGAADYTVWRETTGSSTDLRADGNGDGSVDQLDYAVWKNNFGATVEQPGAGSVEQEVVIMTRITAPQPLDEPATIGREPAAPFAVAPTNPPLPLSGGLRRTSARGEVAATTEPDRVLALWFALRRAPLSVDTESLDIFCAAADRAVTDEAFESFGDGATRGLAIDDWNR